MLSSTYTIEDIKAKLSNDYAYYGYSEETLFDDDIESICDDVYRLYFLPNLGSSEYSRIQAKDRSSLTVFETYLYWAEVFITCFEFLKERGAISGQLQNSGDETLTVEGYTHRIGGGSGAGSSQGDNSVARYYGRAYKYFKLAGIDIASIQRTCSIFEKSDNDDDVVLDIIE
jgi:hypothetical protein